MEEDKSGRRRRSSVKPKRYTHDDDDDSSPKNPDPVASSAKKSNGSNNKTPNDNVGGIKKGGRAAATKKVTPSSSNKDNNKSTRIKIKLSSPGSEGSQSLSPVPSKPTSTARGEKRKAADSEDDTSNARKKKKTEPSNNTARKKVNAKPKDEEGEEDVTPAGGGKGKKAGGKRKPADTEIKVRVMFNKEPVRVRCGFAQLSSEVLSKINMDEDGEKKKKKSDTVKKEETKEGKAKKEGKPKKEEPESEEEEEVSDSESEVDDIDESDVDEIDESDLDDDEEEGGDKKRPGEGEVTLAKLKQPWRLCKHPNCNRYKKARSDGYCRVHYDGPVTEKSAKKTTIKKVKVDEEQAPVKKKLTAKEEVEACFAPDPEPVDDPESMSTDDEAAGDNQVSPSTPAAPPTPKPEYVQPLTPTGNVDHAHKVVDIVDCVLNSKTSLTTLRNSSRDVIKDIVRKNSEIKFGNQFWNNIKLLLHTAIDSKENGEDVDHTWLLKTYATSNNISDDIYKSKPKPKPKTKKPKVTKPKAPPKQIVMDANGLPVFEETPNKKQNYPNNLCKWEGCTKYTQTNCKGYCLTHVNHAQYTEDDALHVTKVRVRVGTRLENTFCQAVLPPTIREKWGFPKHDKEEKGPMDLSYEDQKQPAVDNAASMEVEDSGTGQVEEVLKALYKCPECEKVFVKNGLHAHYGMKHGGSIDISICAVVGHQSAKKKVTKMPAVSTPGSTTAMKVDNEGGNQSGRTQWPPPGKNIDVTANSHLLDFQVTFPAIKKANGSLKCIADDCPKNQQGANGGFCRLHHNQYLICTGQCGSWQCKCGKKIADFQSRCGTCHRWKDGVHSNGNNPNADEARKSITKLSTVDTSEPWTCDECGNVVSGEKGRCGSCNRWRGGKRKGGWKLGVGSDASDDGIDRSQEWECCGETIPAEKTRCGKCNGWRGGKRVAAAAKESSSELEVVLPNWTCAKCQLFNPGNKKRCGGCLTYKKAAPPPQAQAPAPRVAAPKAVVPSVISFPAQDEIDTFPDLPLNEELRIKVETADGPKDVPWCYPPDNKNYYGSIHPALEEPYVCLHFDFNRAYYQHNNYDYLTSGLTDSSKKEAVAGFTSEVDGKETTSAASEDGSDAESSSSPHADDGDDTSELSK